MSFLTPLGLFGLAAIPALIWIWRFASSQHRTVVPSLVPFEHLLRRVPSRRTRVFVNTLFWIQLAALWLLALALAEPALTGVPTRTTLVLLDTSASMAARSGGRSRFQQAQQDLIGRLERGHLGDRVLVMTTAPVARVSPEAADGSSLRQVIEEASVSDLSGNLSLAHRIGQTLLPAPPDNVLVWTDEQAPAIPSAGRVAFHSVGESAANAAIVGIDARESLCTPANSQVVVWVQNFSDAAQRVAVRVSQDGRRLGEESRTLEANGRASLAFQMPDGASGWLEVALSADHDALAVDNRAVVRLRGAEPLRVSVAAEHPEFLATIGRWLDACPRIAWSHADAAGGVSGDARARGDVLITDDPSWTASWPSPVLTFVPREAGDPKTAGGARPVALPWLVEPTHPIAEYLEPLETVPTLVTRSAEGSAGDPVIWAVAQGKRLPVVLASSTRGRRTVSCFFDPSAVSSTVTPVLVFFNSLRWLAASSGFAMTGEPLIVGPFERGTVRVTRPDGRETAISHSGGMLRYDATTKAGRYRFTQGAVTIERAVNFLDPLESDTMQHVSTWVPEQSTAAGHAGQVSRRPLSPWLLRLAFVLLLAEWALYAWRARARGVR